MNKLKSGLLVALGAAALAAPMVTSAAVVTQLIHFDDASNGWKWYSDADLNFLFDPTNLQSSTLCADSTNGGNGSCVIEGTQGVLPTMTRPASGPQSQGSASADPVASGQLSFTLDSFYFLLTGNGMGSENAITVTGGTGSVGSTVVQTYTFALGTNWDGSPLPDVAFYEGANAGNPAGNLIKDTGYIASFGNLFQDVTWIQFSAPSSAQVRLDCVVATFDGTTTQPLKSGTSCGVATDDNSVPVPVPATLALVGLGLLGAAAARRRRSV
jgi:hypothetical protein